MQEIVDDIFIRLSSEIKAYGLQRGHFTCITAMDTLEKACFTNQQV